ncbi:SDR family NAD(P)-dependent oxidoreductase [Pseudofrankia sp. BMG5.36]|uniref:SDR family NAD(P)-dependent oxidoreductase n=1 Tax=Pseudofrankia sp. BMG5.36 TaxID=1834512 RepID=UPI0008DABDE5|nr:SDR family NAD(P)-dependent oxidoreductase [Pseudofrankia sp. BMG5.36]OHV48897.1 short-chain dehydrogenase [Pseudofrankia sp. BMG5.36]
MKIEAGQVAVVTGGASGIGYALAGAFATRGLSVVLADVRPEPLDRAVEALADAHAKALAAAGAGVAAVTTDVSDPDAVQALADTTLERFGRVDVVCNNAGVVGRQAPMWEQTPQTWRWLIDVLLLGVANGVRSFAPSMIAQGRGHFLNTASAAGLMRLPGLGPYSTVKHAVVGLTETLDAELRAAAPEVGASALCPGLVDTSLVATSAAIRPDGAETSEPPAPDDAGSQLPIPGEVLTAAEVAEISIAGIEAGRVRILTHTDSFRPARARLAAVLADVDQAAASRGGSAG